MNRSDLPDKEFEIIVKNMFIKIRRTIREQSRNFSEEIEKKIIFKHQTEATNLKDTATGLKSQQRDSTVD